MCLCYGIVFFIFQTPGKPTALKIQSDSVDLTWSKSEEKVKNYQICYKSEKSQEKVIETEADQNHITITGLMADTKYIFKVRGVFHDQKGQYGPANDEVQTQMSLAHFLRESAELVESGNPATYKLFAQEQKDSRNDDAKTKKLVLGKFFLFDKTIFIPYRNYI